MCPVPVLQKALTQVRMSYKASLKSEGPDHLLKCMPRLLGSLSLHHTFGRKGHGSASTLAAKAVESAAPQPISTASVVKVDFEYARSWTLDDSVAWTFMYSLAISFVLNTNTYICF